MASELVGSAHVDIDINASPAEAALAHLEAKADRTFADLGRKRAEATLDVKTSDFDRKVDKAKGELADLERRKARVSVSLKGDIEKEIAEVKAEIQQLDREKATIKVDSKQLKAANKEQRLLSEARTLDERHAINQAKAERALAAEREKGTQAIQREGKVQARAAAENAKFDAERIDSAIKNRAELAKLSQQYEKLAGKQRLMQRSSRGVFSGRSLGVAEAEARKLERVGSQMDLVKHKIENLGGSVEHLDPEIKRNSSTLGRWLDKLTNTTVRIGPLSTSLKGLAVGMGLLGPLIFNLGGGVVSLAGFLGEGLAGAASVGAGALGGLALSALGVGMVIKPMVTEFSEVKKASLALGKAQLKYGEDSTQAKTAQEQLNHELHGVSPIAREAFESYGQLGSQWRNLTKAARPAVFNAFGQSLKTVQTLLPGFARESTKTTQVAAKAWDSWMKSLRSSEAQTLLGGMMSDFRASIPGLAAGLASLGAMIGRIGAAGAHFLPGLSGGFAEWANNLEQAVGGGQKLTGEVGGLVHQMQDFGHLTQDTGSFIVHFFGASAAAGDGLSNSLDKVIQRWDKWSQTAEGKASLKNFFAESKSTTEDFMSSMSHFTELLFQFSRATAPLANGLLKVVTAIGDIVSAADEVVGIKAVFQGLGVALGALWITSKVLSYGDAVLATGARLAAMVGIGSAAAAAEAEVAAGAAAATVALEAEAVAAVEADVALGAQGIAGTAAAAGSGFGALGASGAKLKEVLLGVSTAVSAGPLGRGSSKFTGVLARVGSKFGSLASGAAAFGAAMLPELIVPAALTAGLVGLAVILEQDKRTIGDVKKEFGAAGHEMSAALTESATATDKYVEAQHRNISASHNAAEARSRLVKLQKENAPVNKITNAVEELGDAERKQAQQAEHTGVVNKQQIKSQHELEVGAKNRMRTARELVRFSSQHLREEKEASEAGHFGGNSYARAKAEKNLATGRRDLAQATRDLSVAQKQEAVTAIPYERHLAGLKPLSEQAETGLRKLVDTIGTSATKKIGSFVDPKDVAQITNLSNKLTNWGRGSGVKKIAVQSTGADQTLGKLRQLQKQTGKVESSRATIKVGANDVQAQSKLKRLSALSQRVTGSKNTINILANSSSADQAISRLRAHLEEVAHKKYQATMSGVDRTGPAAASAYHHLRETASKKYEARITAIDNASSKAKSAEGAGKRAAGGRYQAKITATNAQAMSSINQVNAALAALNGATAKAVLTTEHVTINRTESKGGHFAGGPAAYVAPFAVGGPTDAMLQRAADNAVMVPSGPSRKVNKPTMLTGEEGPTHPEYVIATNPAYANDNERYLKSAAGDLGYEVIPAYRAGHGHGSGHSGHGSGHSSGDSADKSSPGKKPPPISHRTHHYIKATKLNDHDLVNEQHGLEKASENAENSYNTELDHEEREIAAGRLDNWKYALLRGFKHTVAEDQRLLHDKVLPKLAGKIESQKNRAEEALQGTRAQLSQVDKTIGQMENDYDKMEKNKHESTKDYNTKKLHKKHEIGEWKKTQKALKKAKEHEEDLIKEAKKEIAEIRSTLIPDAGNALLTARDDVQYITDVEGGVVEAPYAEAAKEGPTPMDFAKSDLIKAEISGDIPGAEAARAHMIQIAEQNFATALTTPDPTDDVEAGEELKQLRGGAAAGGPATIGEQTATLNAARQTLFNQFASNITSGGTPSYLPGALVGGAGAMAAGAGSPSASGPATVNNVTNNFAAPPPDPHTFTKQISFELGALA